MTNIYSRFKPGVDIPAEEMDNSLWFVFKSGKLLIKNIEGGVHVPTKKDISNINIIRSQYLGGFDGVDCFSAEAADGEVNINNMEFMDLRSTVTLLEEEVYLIAGRAAQIVNWDQTHQYCGRCGTPTVTKYGERAKVCPKCGLLSYPRLSPAIIVAIVNGDKILLAHNKNFRPQLYSVIAGFVEPGETFEECVMREVGEEVNIKVKNIRYFGSQPWPFPHSLMVAFTAEYDSGEIAVDGVEIEHANWYSADNLPTLPSSGSIARKLIQWFLERGAHR